VLPHHEETIRRAVDRFRADDEVLALLLGGSLAHGYAGPGSDVDVMAVVADERFDERRRRNETAWYSRDLATYPEGYVDLKYVSPAYLRLVAEKGSEPARFAFKDSSVLFSRLEGLDDLLAAAVRYPTGKEDRQRRFAAQLEAWNWYAGEALKRDDRYLLDVSVGRLVLFGGRLVLAHNELLYPYHKWFRRVLEEAPDRPDGLLDAIDDLTGRPSPDSVGRFYELVKGWRDWGLAEPWPAVFMADSETNWLDGHTPIDDL
jgi:predicted nucleotidyltransferase